MSRTCHTCLVVRLPSRPEPMARTSMPESPWEVIACDLLGPIDNNIYILVVIDYYSKWIELDILKSINASKIIESYIETNI